MHWSVNKAGLLTADQASGVLTSSDIQTAHTWMQWLSTFLLSSSLSNTHHITLFLVSFGQLLQLPPQHTQQFHC